MEWRRRDGVEWLEATLPGARAAFSTRTGGISRPPYTSLNLGILTGDRREAVVENRRRLATALGLDPTRIAIGRQVHGVDLATHSAPPQDAGFLASRDSIREVDGHITAMPGLAVLVFIADCLPVALSGEGKIAMLHCGWRGMAGGIIERCVEAMGATHAAIGPGIGPCCYEVGEEVLGAFAGLGGDVSSGRMLDLTEVARRLLRQAGVGQVEAAEVCTSCEADRFFSHRRDDGKTGRQAGIAWLEGPRGEERG